MEQGRPRSACPRWLVLATPADIGDKADGGIQTLADKAAVQEVVWRYLVGADRRDFGLMASSYAADATVNFPSVTCEGLDAIIDHCRGVERLAGTWHLVGTQAIDIHEDSATVETYSTVWYRSVSTERTVDLIKGLRYLDTMVRKEGRWLIQHQVITEDWGRTDLVSTTG